MVSTKKHIRSMPKPIANAKNTALEVFPPLCRVRGGIRRGLC